MANKGRNIGGEELSLWERFVDGINPLKKRDGNTPKQNPTAKKGQRSPSPSPMPDVVFPDLNQPRATQNTLDKRTLKKIQSGKAKIEGKIDLHGMTQDQAYHGLKGFLTMSHAQGKRCVLVVTGKGGRHKPEDGFSSIPDGQGILKTRFTDWISRPPLTDIVLRHDPAQQKHGGGGAFYVYLKKNKLT